jgi:uncharacterized protein YbjT (DUF2867 family)
LFISSGGRRFLSSESHLLSRQQSFSSSSPQQQQQQQSTKTWRRKRQGKCAYSTRGNVHYTSEPLDIVAEVKSQKILVLGGSGFVGTAICKAAVARGIEVTSLSRSGRPSYLDPWLDRVTWISGDVFTTDLDALLDGVSVVVSTLGGFGSNEQMEKINGEANILAVNAAKRAGVPRYILISVHQYNLPTFALNNGYFSGKRKAEAEVLSLYPNSGTVLQPGVIYGKRKVNGVDIPLGWVGEPLKKLIAATSAFTRPLKNLPASDLFLAPPVSVDDVANAVVKAVSDNDIFGTFNIEQIDSMAKN